MKKFLPIIMTLLSLTSLEAREPFHATVTVDTDSATVSAPNLVDLNRDLRSSNIQDLIPLYTPVSAVSLDINLRGLIANTSFAANSTNLIVNIPDAGITTSFDGGSRDQSLALFRQFIKDGGSAIPKLLKAYARYSPIDPIAGNPNSLMNQMAQADYLLGSLSPLSGCDSCWSAQPIVHQFQAGTLATRAFSKGYDTTSITVPLRYSYSPQGTWAFVLDAPFTYNRNGGASSIYSSLGLGLRMPVTDDWSVTPTFRMGSGGSLDLACSGTFISTGLISVYNLSVCDFVLSLTNYAGYITSTNFWLTGVNFNYHLQNYIFKNGLSITSCKGYSVCNRPIYLKVAFEDSYFAGKRLYIRHFDEVSVALITTHVLPHLDYDCLSLGFGYQFGEKSYKGYTLNIVYQF